MTSVATARPLPRLVTCADGDAAVATTSNPTVTLEVSVQTSAAEAGHSRGLRLRAMCLSIEPMLLTSRR